MALTTAAANCLHGATRSSYAHCHASPVPATGTPFVIDLSPSWRSPLWAEAVCVLDAVLWWGAPARALDDWSVGAHRQAMLRAALFRVLADQPCDVARYHALGLT